MTAAEFSERLRAFPTAFKQSQNRIALIVVIAILAEMHRRIFNRGRATDGSPIGEYHDPDWIAIRQKRGRQTSYVDLQMEGILFQAFTFGVTDKKATIGFTNGKYTKGYYRKLYKSIGKKKVGDFIAEANAGKRIYQVAAENEARFGKTIFQPSKNELLIGAIAFETELQNLIKKHFIGNK